MKILRYILSLSFLLFVLDNSAQDNLVKFDKYYNELPQLDFPIYFNSNKPVKFKIPEIKLDTEVVWKVRIDIGFNVLGKLYETENFYAIVGVIANDTGSPMIITVGKNNKEIDKFFGYKTAQYDMGYYRSNLIKITSDMKIQLTDSLLTRQIMEDGSGEVQGTDSLSVTKTDYIISENGKFKYYR